MKELTITQAEITINTLRVGTKQVTQAMWKQIPDIEPSTDRNWPKPLGYVKYSGVGGYLFNIDGHPKKMCLTASKVPTLNYLETFEGWRLNQDRQEMGLRWFSKKFVNDMFFIGKVNWILRHPPLGWRLCDEGLISADTSDECKESISEFISRGISIKNKKLKHRDGYYSERLFVAESELLLVKAKTKASCESEINDVTSYVELLFHGIPQLYIGV